jgi:AcrR family transcriptional regulator
MPRLRARRFLASARQAFARRGYDSVGVREIARGARVTAMLVNRYFGSKEQLFAEAVADTMTAPATLTHEVTNSSTLGQDLAAALVDQTNAGASPLDGFLIMLRSASNRRAAEIYREQVENHHQKVMTAALGGDMAAAWAAVVLSLMAGFQSMRQMIGLSALVEVEPAALKTILASVFQELI